MTNVAGVVLVGVAGVGRPGQTVDSVCEQSPVTLRNRVVRVLCYNLGISMPKVEARVARRKRPAFAIFRRRRATRAEKNCPY